MKLFEAIRLPLEKKSSVFFPAKTKQIDNETASMKPRKIVTTSGFRMPNLRKHSIAYAARACKWKIDGTPVTRSVMHSLGHETHNERCCTEKAPTRKKKSFCQRPKKQKKKAKIKVELGVSSFSLVRAPRTIDFTRAPAWNQIYATCKITFLAWSITARSVYYTCTHAFGYYLRVINVVLFLSLSFSLVTDGRFHFRDRLLHFLSLSTSRPRKLRF